MPTRPTKPTGTAAGARAAPARGPPQAEDGPAAQENAAFTLWLRRSLQECHDSIAAEPVPEDLLRLVEEDRAERERIRRLRARTRK